MEGDRDGEENGARYAPSCRRCLALLDTLFPAPKLNDRFPLIVRIIADTVLAHGIAEILDVPGDQQAALRKAVRAEVKQRLGYGFEDLCPRDMVIFVCDPIYYMHADEHMHRGTEAMDAFLSCKPCPVSHLHGCGGVYGQLNEDRRKCWHATPSREGRERPGCQAASGGRHQGMSFRLLVQRLRR